MPRRDRPDGLDRPGHSAKHGLMNTLHRRRSARSRPGRVAPRFDRLEARLALSAGGSSAVVVSASSPSGPSGGPNVLATDPSTGSTLARAPASIAVTFSRPVALGPDPGDFRL